MLISINKSVRQYQINPNKQAKDLSLLESKAKTKSKKTSFFPSQQARIHFSKILDRR
uniref:Uncharacterized protein n=1 Tax=Arundo donax TaxID=35708 RepID=A0A0A9E2S2_ARUDO